MPTKPYTLITGASSGIGKELALIAAHEGHNIVLVARNKSELTRLAQQLTKQHDIFAETIAVDLTEPSSPQKIYETLARQKITVDILINNAGFGDYGQFVSSDKSTQLAMIDLNIRSLTELTHLLLPAMVKRRYGYIMNIGSVASFIPGPLMSVYFASKAYVLSFTEALSQELRGTGVSATCLCPGSTKTNFGEAAHVSKTHSTRNSRVTAAQVAAFGWKAMLRKKPVAIYGTGNRLSMFALRFLPRNVIARLVEHMQK